MRQSFERGKLSNEYIIKNKIVYHLNAAAGWQAIERGYGTTIIGDGKGKSSPFFPNFLKMKEKGDSEILQAERFIRKQINTTNNSPFEESLIRWHKGYKALLSARPKIAGNDISKDEWLYTATLNIRNEFALRNITFIPERKEEEILYLNNVLRPNIATLCEYAGLERALVGNAIASGDLLSDETIKKIKEYRSIVEQSLEQIFLLKDSPYTSSRIKNAIYRFEEEFLDKFQRLRERIFEDSIRQKKQIKVSSIQIVNRQKIFYSYLTGVSDDLLKISRHKNVIALAEALNNDEDANLSVRLNGVENLFNIYSQIKRTYDQIRYLDNFGHERVRVDFDGNDTKTIRGQQLQDKSDMYYYKESIKLSPGDIYISPLDLNIEHGKIEYPHKPVMRFITPVSVDGKRTGIIVFNLRANTTRFLHGAIEKETEGDYILVNQDGFYLHHPNEVKEWGMMETLNRSHHNIKHDYPYVAEHILSGREGNVRLTFGELLLYKPFFLNDVVSTGKYWVTIKQIQPMRYLVDARTWFDRATKAIDSGLAISNIAGEEANSAMLEMESASKQNVQVNILIFVLTILGFTLFIWWSRTRVLRPIQRLTGIAQKIARGDFSCKVEVMSDNEIGKLSSSFNQMAFDLQESGKVLQESEEQFRLISTSAQEAIIMLDNDGKISYWNDAAAKIFGYLKEETKGKNIHNLIIPEKLQEAHMIGFEKFKDTGQGPVIGKTVELTAVRKDGAEFPISMSISSVKIKDKWNAIGIIRDITERKRTEEELKKYQAHLETLVEKRTKKLKDAQDQLVRKEKLSAIGQVSGSIAHELRNPLGLIKNSSYYLSMVLKDVDDKVKEHLAIINDTVLLSSNIINNLLNLSKVGSLSPVKSDVNRIVKDVLANFKTVEGITIKTQLDENLPAMPLDLIRISSVFNNIISNALQAMPEGGRLEIKTGVKDEYVEVEFHDTGVGISKENIKKIYEPLFTTRAKGIGLGLALVKTIIDEHNGIILVESEIGKGTTFTLRFPIATETTQEKVLPGPSQNT